MNEQYETGYMIVDPKGLWLQFTIRENETDCKNDYVKMKNDSKNLAYGHNLVDWEELQELGYSVKKVKIEIIEE